MSATEKKLSVLSRVAEKLNHENITWAVGASLLLYLKGIVHEFADIDIMIAEDDADRAREILLTFGRQLPAKPNTLYQTKYFGEFEVDGVDFDIMAGFSIVHDGAALYFPLEKEQMRDYADINGVKIPLHSVEKWRYFYELMGRTHKVEMIDQATLGG